MAARQATMESLPEEMVEYLSQFLTGADLASCCGASHSWREMFGKDSIWKVHCDETLAKYLDTTSCVVKPHFVSPEVKDSTLSPISHWRLNYMKKIHLWNNWSMGNYEISQCIEKKDLLPTVVIKNDFILKFRSQEIEVWDAQEKVPICKARIEFKRYTHIQFMAYRVKGTNNIVVTEDLLVRVYSFCCTTYVIQLLHVFTFEMPEKSSETTEESAMELALRKNQNILVHTTVVGNIFVGIVHEIPLKMHIWNLDTGEKLKEENWPFREGIFTPIKRIEACENTMNMVVEGVERVEAKIKVHWYVYSLSKRMFLPFHTVQEFQSGGSYNIYDIQSIIFDKYIVIKAQSTMYVYNYLTSEMMYTTPSDGRHLLSFRNYVVFRHNNILHAVNPSNRSGEMDIIVIDRSWMVEALGSRAIMFKRLGDEKTTFTFTTTQIKEGHKLISVPLIQGTFFFCNAINDTGTKLVLADDNVNKKLYVLNFW